MSAKPNLPALAIVGASLSEIPNVIKGVFLYFWPFLLLYFLKDYFLISSKEVGTDNAAFIVSILTIILMLLLIAVQVCWYQKVITKENFKYLFDKRSLITIGYSLLYFLFIGGGIFGITLLFALMSRSDMMTSDFAITITIISFFVLLSIAFRFMIIFPAIAVNNQKTRLKRSWELTKGYHIKLFFMMIGFVILVSIPSVLVEFLSRTMGIDSVVKFLITMFFLNTLSLVSLLLISEMVGRLFVFFHVPEKIKDYL